MNKDTVLTDGDRKAIQYFLSNQDYKAADAMLYSRLMTICYEQNLNLVEVAQQTIGFQGKYLIS